MWGDGHFHHNHVNHCDKHYHLAKRGEQLSQKAFQEFCRCLPLMPRTARLLRRPGITEKEKVIVLLKTSGIGEKGKVVESKCIFLTPESVCFEYSKTFFFYLLGARIYREGTTRRVTKCAGVSVAVVTAEK